MYQVYIYIHMAFQGRQRALWGNCTIESWRAVREKIRAVTAGSLNSFKPTARITHLKSRNAVLLSFKVYYIPCRSDEDRSMVHNTP